jgi:hypothetical protein
VFGRKIDRTMQEERDAALEAEFFAADNGHGG